MDNGHADYDKTKKSLDKTKLSGETGKGFEFLVSFTHLMEKSKTRWYFVFLQAEDIPNYKQIL